MKRFKAFSVHQTRIKTARNVHRHMPATEHDSVQMHHPIIARQAKSPAAESAIKMNVYQTDSAGEEVAQPEPVRRTVEEDVAVEEPTKRESAKASAEEKTISDVVKKWSKK